MELEGHGTEPGPELILATSIMLVECLDFRAHGPREPQNFARQSIAWIGDFTRIHGAEGAAILYSFTPMGRPMAR